MYNFFEKSGKVFFERNLTIFANQPNLKFLQLGVWLGHASIWMLDNILTDPTSELHDVDVWEETEGQDMDWKPILNLYKNNLSKYKNIYSYKELTVDFLNKNNILYDFIYIDANHTPEAVYLDGCLSWNYLKPGGIMAFDDYEWINPETNIATKPGVDKFLNEFLGNYTIIDIGWQVWIKKN